MKTKKEIISKVWTDLDKTRLTSQIENDLIDDVVDSVLKAINYTRCCKSNSEKLFCQCNKPAQWTTDEGFTGCVKCNKEIKAK